MLEDETTVAGGPDPPAFAPLTSGTEIAGRYTLGLPLGAGGFGEVYRAEDRVLRRIVAVKVLRPKSELVWSDPAFGAFLAEARTIARLDHPNIVPVHDAGVHEGRPWMRCGWWRERAWPSSSGAIRGWTSRAPCGCWGASHRRWDMHTGVVSCTGTSSPGRGRS